MMFCTCHRQLNISVPCLEKWSPNPTNRISSYSPTSSQMFETTAAVGLYNSRRKGDRLSRLGGFRKKIESNSIFSAEWHCTGRWGADGLPLWETTHVAEEIAKGPLRHTTTDRRHPLARHDNRLMIKTTRFSRLSGDDLQSRSECPSVRPSVHAVSIFSKS